MDPEIAEEHSTNRISTDLFSGNMVQSLFKLKDMAIVAHWSSLIKVIYPKVAVAVAQRMPKVVKGGVNTAAIGIIQDPAGSAIGSGKAPAGGGASGAIYKTFRDLNPIPNIPPGASVFNSSQGPGSRVLHTHSHMLAGDPNVIADVISVVTKLANSYYNAFATVAAAKHRGDEEGEGDANIALSIHGNRLNLVPVSASIYAGPFANDNFMMPHLDPSFTMLALAIAIGHVLTEGGNVPELFLYYFDAEVYQVACKL